MFKVRFNAYLWRYEAEELCDGGSSSEKICFIYGNEFFIYEENTEFEEPSKYDDSVSYGKYVTHHSLKAVSEEKFAEVLHQMYVDSDPHNILKMSRDDIDVSGIHIRITQKEGMDTIELPVEISELPKGSKLAKLAVLQNHIGGQ